MTLAGIARFTVNGARGFYGVRAAAGGPWHRLGADGRPACGTRFTGSSIGEHVLVSDGMRVCRRCFPGGTA